MNNASKGPSILVIGATGTIGQLLVQRLKSQGANFKAFVRDAQKAAALACPLVVGDLDDASSLATALDDIDVVFLNSAPGEAMVRQQIGLIDAAKLAGVSKIVAISAPAADSASPSFLGKSHGVVDDYLRASGIGWVILQPSSFMQNFLHYGDSIKAQGKFFGAYGDGQIGFIDVEDIASVAAVTLLSTQHLNQTIVITGDELLSHADTALLFSQHLGKQIAYVDVPAEVMVGQMMAGGLPEQFASALGKMMEGMSKGSAAFKNDKVFEITGQKPCSFSQFISANIAVFQ